MGECLIAQSIGGVSMGVPPNDVVYARAYGGNKRVTISWTDPENIVLDGKVVSVWLGTKLVRKAGAYPANVDDGVLVVDNQMKDLYGEKGFVDEYLTNDVKYYYQLFPYADTGAMNTNVVNRLTATPKDYVVYGVTYSGASNPVTSLTYTDSAVGMTPGSDEWDKIFGMRPCLFKDGKVVGYLNPDNFAQFENGLPADITSGDAGDVMIEFPRLGIDISTVGVTMTVKITNEPNAPEFTYYAHSRGKQEKDYFYLGAYQGFILENKLTSLKGKTPTLTGLANGIGFAQAKGSGYEMFAYYQYVFIQALYIMKYKSLNSRSAVGHGMLNSTNSVPYYSITGNTYSNGMNYGTSNMNEQMKLFGIEDLWGNYIERICGIMTDSIVGILTTNKNFNITGDGYINHGQLKTISGFTNTNTGNNLTGFLTTGNSGSYTTYYCNYANLVANAHMISGFRSSDWSYEGIFCTMLSANATSNASVRLMYL